MKRHIFILLSASIIPLLVAISAYGQADVATATLTGTVTDPSGAVVPGAKITISQPDRGFQKTVVSDNAGAYQIPLLPPGVYQLETEAQGFSKTVATRLELTIGQTLVYNISLRVGAVNSVVEVTADAPLIQLEQTQQADTINPAQVENLPNIDRNFTQAVYTLPGVSNANTPRSSGQTPGFTGFATTGFSIGGSNGRNNLSTIDGGENEYGTGQYRVTTIPIDDIQEYQVNRNSFAAEYGFTIGSAINIVTKSGSDQFHGSAYIYFRDSALQSQNFFNQFEPNPDTFNQHLFPGLTFGGPLIKDKLFFFVSYEFQKIDLPGPNEGGVPNFFLNNPDVLGIDAPANSGCTACTAQATYLHQLSTSGNPTLQAIAAGLAPAFVPQNNPTFNQILTRDNGGSDVLTKSHTVISRLDYLPDSNDAMTLRFTFVQGLFGDEEYADGIGLRDTDYSILYNWSHTLSSTLVNDFRTQIVPWDEADTTQNQNNGVFDVIVDPGLVFLPGESDFYPYLAHQTRMQFDDTLAWTKGKHNFKFGVSDRPVDYHLTEPLYFTGEFDFIGGLLPILGVAVPATGAAGTDLAVFDLTNGPCGPLSASCTTPYAKLKGPSKTFTLTTAGTATNLTGAESFVLGLPVLYHQGFNNPTWQGWANYLGTFAQDSWKVSNRFTLDYGVRFDADFEPSPLSENSYVSPRLGFAWDPWGDGKTVIRGGSGVFEGPIDELIPSYGSILNGSGKYINQLVEEFPASTEIYQAGLAAGLFPFGHPSQSFIESLGFQVGPNAPGRDVFEIAPNYKNPYSVQASLSVQREIAHNLSLEVGYNMYHGVHLQMPVESNYAPTKNPAAAGATAAQQLAEFGSTFQGTLYAPINASIDSQTDYKSIGDSIYHGLTTSLTKRFSSHVQFRVNYTFSHAIDNVNDFASFQNWFRPTELNLDRGTSTFDFTHVFVANAVVETPFRAGPGESFVSRALADITVSPILTLQSGLPYTILTPGLDNGLPPGGFLDGNFAAPFYEPRNPDRTPYYGTLDLLIRKSFFIGSERRVRMEIIAEGTNITNRVNFNHVNNDFPLIPGPFTMANGQTINLATGPYSGVKGFVPNSAAQLGDPGAYIGADLPRQIQFGIRLGF